MPAVSFSNFTLKDVVVYSLLGIFFIAFALYYRKRTQGSSLGVIQHRKAYLESHKELNEEVFRAIERGEIVKGMSKEEVTAAIGPPRRIQLLRTQPVNNEVWIYRNGIYAAMEEGILQKWDIRKKLISLR